MNTLKTFLVLLCLFVSIFAVPGYISHITLAETDDEPSPDKFTRKFIIDKEKIKQQYGQTYGVPIYQFELSEFCEMSAPDVNLPDWFAVYLYVPAKCGERSLVKELEAQGVDFAFLVRESTEEPKTNLLSHDIGIPIYELDERQDSTFYSALKARGNGSVMTITLPFPKAVNGVTSLELFYTPTNYRSFQYIEQLEHVTEALGKHVSFEPFIVLFSNTRNPASKNCINGGKYCAPDPDSDGNANGALVVMEMLREKCVHKLNGAQWFPYMKAWKNRCMDNFTEKCSIHTIRKFSTVNDEMVKTCIRENSLTVGNGGNPLADAEMKKLKESHEMTFPALYINGQRFDGHVKSTEIMIKACDTFDFKPQACQEVSVDYEGSHMSIVWSILIYLYVLMLGLVVIAFACIGIAKRVARR